MPKPPRKTNLSLNIGGAKEKPRRGETYAVGVLYSLRLVGDA